EVLERSSVLPTSPECCDEGALEISDKASLSLLDVLSLLDLPTPRI
ncbi:hypothetical protein CP061683_0305B, partial [Chlamydia psittaci 06-1683]